jgi:hypothetical protein
MKQRIKPNAPTVLTDNQQRRFLGLPEVRQPPRDGVGNPPVQSMAHLKREHLDHGRGTSHNETREFLGGQSTPEHLKGWADYASNHSFRRNASDFKRQAEGKAATDMFQDKRRWRP